MNTPDPTVQRIWDIVHPGNKGLTPEQILAEVRRVSQANQEEHAPLPTELGRYVIEGGTSVNHWASEEFIMQPSGEWARVIYVPTTEADIRARLFDGQKLERLVPESETDL